MSGDKGAIGLHEKYLVIRRDHIIEGSETELPNGTVRLEFIPNEEARHKRLFVLSPATDPAAFVALWNYARFCYPRLSGELKGQLAAIRRFGMSLTETGRLNLPTALDAMISRIVGEEDD